MQFWQLTQTLADNIIDAGIHCRLSRDLVAAIRQFRRLFNEAAAFWTLTFATHRDSAVTNRLQAAINASTS